MFRLQKKLFSTVFLWVLYEAVLHTYSCKTQTLDFFFFHVLLLERDPRWIFTDEVQQTAHPAHECFRFPLSAGRNVIFSAAKNCSGYTSRVLFLFFRWQPQIQATTLLTPVHNQIISLFFIFCQEMILVGYLMRWTFLLPMLVHNRTCQPSRPNCHTQGKVTPTTTPRMPVSSLCRGATGRGIKNARVRLAFQSTMCTLLQTPGTFFSPREWTQ